MQKKLLALMPLMFLLGCVSQRYDWHGYDDHLYSYYKDPNQKEKFIEQLKEAIVEGEKTGKIPPGMYAEYGYLCYEGQDYKDAITYFQKEYDLWPESQFFMAKMISNAKTMLSKVGSKGSV